MLTAFSLHLNIPVLTPMGKDDPGLSGTIEQRQLEMDRACSLILLIGTSG